MTTLSDVVSADGTVVRAWRSGGDGVPLVVSNGLGSVPSAWPALLAADSGYRALGWYHRGTFGTARPTDPSHVHVEHHVEDLVAVMDAAGVERAVVAAWSIGVNVAFEAARRHPGRVAGILGVAGVPGGTFATMGGPLHVPRMLRVPLGSATVRAARFAAPLLNRLVPVVPVDRRLAWLLAHSGFMLPGARPEHLVPMLREFVGQDWGWYMTLALAAKEHAAMDTADSRCPVTLIAGQHDVLTSVHDVVQAASRLPDAEVVVLPGSHFLTLEHPDRVQAALDALVTRSALARPAGQPA